MRVLAGAASYQNNQPGPRLAPPSPRFHTIVGLPATIALKYTTGKQVRSPKSGNMDMMYTLTTGERAFFPLNVGAAIDSLTLAPGQPFTVCHLGGDNWDIERVHPEQPQQYNPPPPRPNPHPPLPPAAQSPQLMNGAGETAADLYLQHFQSAIDIVLAGVPMANAKGLMVAPTFEDIRCIATHLSIAREKQS